MLATAHEDMCNCDAGRQLLLAGVQCYNLIGIKDEKRYKMGDYDGHSSRGDSDLGLATGHLWSAAPGGIIRYRQDTGTRPWTEGGYIWSGQMLGWRQRGENQDGFVTEWTLGLP